MRSMQRTAASAALASLLALTAAFPAAPALAADEPGQRFRLTFADLPRPGATPSASNPSRAIARPANATLQVPPGFQVNLFADRLDNARWMTVAPNGDVFLAEPDGGKITLLRDANNDGVAEVRSTFVTGLSNVHGIAVHGDFFYATTPANIFRIPYRPGDTQASAPPVRVGVANSLGDGAGHFTRNIAFSPDGQLFVAVGSRGNIAVEPEVRASVQRFDANGGNQMTFGSGLRNPVGIAFRPGSNDLYVVVNERDGYGDGLVPDFLTRVQQGDFYGWPYAYLGPNPSAGTFGTQRPDMVARTKAPDVLFEAHSAPLGLAFYDAQQFPAEYHGDAFVALHGSWNSGKPTGYKVVRVPFVNGRPTGEYVNFATGFWASGTTRAEVWGRPVGIVVARDGSLLIADDVGNAVWRISYRG
jgi:glucose/arabinose dehydrogenase